MVVCEKPRPRAGRNTLLAAARELNLVMIRHSMFWSARVSPKLCSACSVKSCLIGSLMASSPVSHVMYLCRAAVPMASATVAAVAAMVLLGAAMFVSYGGSATTTVQQVFDAFMVSCLCRLARQAELFQEIYWLNISSRVGPLLSASLALFMARLCPQMSPKP